MKFIIYFVLVMIGFFLFIPTNGTEIRNLPILIALCLLVVGVLLFKIICRTVFVHRVKRSLKNHGCEIIKTHFNPFASRFHGRYSVLCQKDGKVVCLVFISRKRKYQKYHFESVEMLEFYSSNRVIFQSTKIRGATVSNLVETKLVGKQKLVWDKADVNVVVFDKIPDLITDSTQKELLGKGDKVCGGETYIADIESFSEYLTEINS